ncbi:MAG: hypothetical protein J0I07_31600 [Myxococcales bacterium]|nr:hypothetical protein [Myxococcales bacterium]
MTRKQRVTRVVYGAYVVVVAAFVVSNIAQVASTVFSGREGGSEAAAADPRFPKVGPACAKLFEEQVQAIEKARQAASSEASAEAAKARYESERSAARSPDLERTCSAEPSGTDALASLARLDRQAESESVRSATELRSVRLAAQSFISGHPK